MLLPAYRSAAYLLKPRIHRASMTNEIGEELTDRISEIRADGDIDRAGAKYRVELTSTDPDALPVASWIARFLEVVPETGAIEESQVGLYELGEPRIVETGIGPGIAENSGEDIVARLDRAVLTEAQRSEKAANVMHEVRYAIALGTLSNVGPNLVTNGDFADGLTGWTTGSDSSGWAGSESVLSSSSYPGGRAYTPTFPAATPAGAYRWVQSGDLAIPPGMSRLLLSLWLYADEGMETRLVLRFPGMGAGEYQMTPYTSPSRHLWHRAWVVVDVPAGATTVRAMVYGRRPAAGSGTLRFYASHVEMRAVAGTPLTRLALPEDRRGIATPIAHPAGTRWLTRIDDLLQAIAYHGATSTMDGRPTTRPQRDPRSDTPARVYTLGLDSRLVGEVVTDRAATNVANTIVAVKEDWETGVPLVAVATNDDTDHPWSTVNRGVIAPPEPLVVSDAVDQAALQALADAALARASMQESLQIDVLPDPALTVHDVIEIAGTDGRAKGRWAIESISGGEGPANPLVRIGARRTITTTEAQS